MSHKEVLEHFKKYFPQYAENMEQWFPNGKNSVRVRKQHMPDVVFTYNNIQDWRFETVDSYINSMRGGR